MGGRGVAVLIDVRRALGIGVGCRVRPCLSEVSSVFPIEVPGLITPLVPCLNTDVLVRRACTDGAWCVASVVSGR